MGHLTFFAEYLLCNVNFSRMSFLVPGHKISLSLSHAPLWLSLPFYMRVISLQSDIKCFDIFSGLWIADRWLSDILKQQNIPNWAVVGIVGVGLGVWTNDEEPARAEVNPDRFFPRLCLHQSRANLSKELPARHQYVRLQVLLSEQWSSTNKKVPI